MLLQKTELHSEIDDLQRKHGAPELSAIYGAGCINNPEVMLMFMNPTGKNISADLKWNGLRAPWVGTKNIWSILHEVGLISKKIFQLTQQEWDETSTRAVYENIARGKIYITNLAKCTQIDARHLSDSVFQVYVPNMKKEIALINPKRIITFGNQVSSILLGKPLSVSKYTGNEKEFCTIDGKSFDVYPVYYPIGQGRRNQPSAINRIKMILK